MSDLVELYRWPDGYTMCRPTTQRDLSSEEWALVKADVAWIFTLVGPDGQVFANWFLASEDGDQESIWRCQVKQEGFYRPSARVYDVDERWAAFYLDLLVSRDRALSGDFLPDYYIDNRLPLLVSESAVDPSSEGVREVEELSREYTGMVFTGRAWVGASEEAEQIESQIKYFMMDFEVSNRSFSMRFNDFESPGGWLLSDPGFENRAHWEWIVVNEDHTVIGVGHTPLGALASVQQFVWPDSVATDLLPSLDAWMEKWTLQGTISQNLEMYKLLGLPTPAVMVHSQFLEWAKGMESGS